MEVRIAIYLVLAMLMSGLFAYAIRQIHKTQRVARTFRAIAERLAAISSRVGGFGQITHTLDHCPQPIGTLRGKMVVQVKT